ncbi:MAG: hypothetical protein ACI4U4_02845, partial [Bacilli bacterium]
MGKNRDTYRVNPDVIKRKGNTFNEAKSKYVSDCYKVWKSSYLNTNKSNVVTALNNKVSSHMENILNSYKNLVAFFEDYYNEIVDLEKALSDGSLPTSKVIDVKTAISQLNAMAEGYDPDDIVINPKTGEFNEGSTKQVVAQSISALGVKDDFKVYVDASGKYREAENMTSSEYMKYDYAVRTFGAQPDKINDYIGHETAVKLAGLNARSVSKSPAVYGVMDASPFMLKSTGSTAFGGIYSDAEIATIEAAKQSGAYQYSYIGTQTVIFFALGGTGAAEAVGSTVLKSVGRLGTKKAFYEVVGDTIVNAPLNVSDALKQSQNVRGRINSDSFKVNLLSTTAADVGLGGGMALGGKILKPLSSAISPTKSTSVSTSGAVSTNKSGKAGTNIPDIIKPNDNPVTKPTPEIKKPTSSNSAPKTKNTKPVSSKPALKTKNTKPAETKTAPKTNDSKPAETKTTPKTEGAKPIETKVEKQSDNSSYITDPTNTSKKAPEPSTLKTQTTTEKKPSTDDKKIVKNEGLNKQKDEPQATPSKPTSESKTSPRNNDRTIEEIKNTNADIGSKEVGKETMKRRVITRVVKNKDEVALKATGTDGKPLTMKKETPQNTTIDYEMVNKNIDDSSNVIPLKDMSSTGSSGNGNVTPITSVNSKSVNETFNPQQQNLEMSGTYIYDQYRKANDSVTIEKLNPKTQKLEELNPANSSKKGKKIEDKQSNTKTQEELEMSKKQLDEEIYEKQKEYLDKQIEVEPSSDKSVPPEEKLVETKKTSKKTEPEAKDTSSAKSNNEESHLAEKQKEFTYSKKELKDKYKDYENANKKQQEALEKHGINSEEYKLAKKEAEQKLEELNSAANNSKTKQQELRKLEESKSASTKKTSQTSQSANNVDNIESRITEIETSKKKVEDARKELETAEKKLKDAKRKAYETEIDVANTEKLFDKDELPVEKASEKYNNARDKVADKEKALEDAYKNSDEKMKKLDEIDEEYNKKYEEYKLASDKEIEMLKKYGIDSEEYELAYTEFKAKEKEFAQLDQDLNKSIEDLEQSNLEVDVATEELEKAELEFDKVEEEFFNEEFKKVDQAQEQADKIENQAQQQLNEAKKKYEIAKNEYLSKQSRLTETINYEPRFEKIKEIKQSLANNHKMVREQAIEKLKKLDENLDNVRTSFGVNSKQYKELKSAIAKKREELKTITERISKRRDGINKYFEDLKADLSETLDIPSKRTVTGETAPVGKSEPIDKVGTKTEEPAISKNKAGDEIQDTSSPKNNKDESPSTTEEQMPIETSKKKVEDARKELETAEKKLKDAKRKAYETEIDVANTEKLFDKDELPVEKASEKYNNARDKVADKEKALEDAYKNSDEKMKKLDEIDEEYNKKYEEYKLASDKEIEMLKKYGIDSEEYELAYTEFKAKEKEFAQLDQDLNKSIEDLEQSNLEVDVATEELEKAELEFDKVEEEFFNEEFKKVDQAQEQADKIENQAQQQLNEAKKKYEIAKNEYLSKQSRLTETINYEPRFEKIKEIKQSLANNHKMVREQAIEKLKKLDENLDNVRTSFGVNSKQYKELKSAIAKKREELKTITERISKRRDGINKYFEDLKADLSETLDIPSKRTVTGETAPVGKSEPIDKVGTKTEEPAISKNKAGDEIQDTSSPKNNKDESPSTTEEQMPKENQTTTYKGDSSLKNAINDLVEKGKNLQKTQNELDLIKESISNSKKEFNDVLENQGITYEKVSSGEIKLKEGNAIEKYYSEISKAEEDYQKYLSIVNKEKDQFMKDRKEMLELRDKLDEFKQNYDCDYYAVKHGNKEMPAEAKELFEEIKSREEKYKFDNDSNMKVKETQTKATEIDNTEEISLSMKDSSELTEVEDQIKTIENKIDDLETDVRLKEKADDFSKKELDKIMKESKAKDKQIEKFEQETKLVKESYGDLEKRLRDSTPEDIDRQLEIQIKEKQKILDDIELERKAKELSDYDFIYDPSPENVISNLETVKKNEFLELSRLIKEKNSIKNSKVLTSDQIKNLETKYNNQIIENHDRIIAIDARIKELKRPNSKEFEDLLLSSRDKVDVSDLEKRMQDNIDMMFNKKVNIRKPFNAKELKQEIKSLEIQKKMLKNMEDAKKEIESYDKAIYVMKHNANSQTAKQVKEIDPVGINSYYRKNYPKIVKELEESKKTLKELQEQREELLKTKKSDIESTDLIEEITPEKVEELLGENPNQKDNIIELPTNNRKIQESSDDLKAANGEEIEGEKSIEDESNNEKVSEDSSEKTDNDKRKVKKVKKIATGTVLTGGGITGLTALITKCDGNENTTGVEKPTMPEDDNSVPNNDVPEDDKSVPNNDVPKDDKSNTSKDNLSTSGNTNSNSGDKNQVSDNNTSTSQGNTNSNSGDKNQVSDNNTSTSQGNTNSNSDDKNQVSDNNTSTSQGNTNSNSDDKNQVSDNNTSTSQGNTN